VRLATTHAAYDLLGMDSVNEDDLYANLDWLSENQHGIEDRLYAPALSRKKAALVSLRCDQHRTDTRA
jgi:hypothetical protein